MGTPAENPSSAPEDALALRQLLRRLGIGVELFVVAEDARGAGAEARPEITGARLYGADPEQPGGSRERETQTDLADVVSAVAKLRGEPGWEGAVLSREHVRGGQRGEEAARVRFALDRTGPRDETGAAELCHGRIVSALARCGFRVLTPAEFDSANGFRGLERWAAAVRLERRWRPSPSLLLLLLPLLLLLLPWQCTPVVKTDFIIIVDCSTSMKDAFPKVRDATKELLEKMQAKGHSADLIFFAQDAKSTWKKLEPLTDERVAELVGKLNPSAIPGGTNIRSGILQAAEEVRAHSKKTTLILLTDGDDDHGPSLPHKDTLQEMVDDIPGTKSLFGGKDVMIFATTPRILLGQPAPAPGTEPHRNEENLTKLCKSFCGKLGSLPLAY